MYTPNSYGTGSPPPSQPSPLRRALPTPNQPYRQLSGDADSTGIDLDIDSNDPFRQQQSPERAYDPYAPSSHVSVSLPPSNPLEEFERRYASPSPPPRLVHQQQQQQQQAYHQPSIHQQLDDDYYDEKSDYYAHGRLDNNNYDDDYQDDYNTNYDHDPYSDYGEYAIDLGRKGSTSSKTGSFWTRSDDQQVEYAEDDEKPSNVHYGPAPDIQARRNKTLKRVPLTKGHLVLDSPIPERLKGFLPRRDEPEFETMRYTAVTCEPDEFSKQDYSLRPAILNRDTELLIGITMYNENEVLFCRTVYHVMKNIAHLCSRQKSRTWGKDGWKKIVVCIIADGRKHVHPRVLDVLAAMGIYQDGIAKNQINNQNVTSHLYEFTTQLAVDPDLKFRGLEKGIVPTQFILCVKEKNGKKINSHRWLFDSFAKVLNPTICVLLDVGTKPGPKSLYHLWKTFDLNSNVGGACGEICVMKGKFGKELLNPLVAAQNFEYKISNILDKPTESLFGYITVLPGAFSAYRYIALQNDEMGHGPLASYFKGEHLAGYDADVFTSNTYLAEDRILCWELVAKRGHAWILKFVKSATGETDVPDSVAEFISQRRRWLNGSFFALTYSLTHTLSILPTSHSAGRKFFLIVEAFYNSINLIFSWFSIANWYIFFVLVTSALEAEAFGMEWIKYINVIMQYGYVGVTIAIFLFSMGNRPQGSKWKYTLAMAAYALLAIYMMIAAILCLVKALSDFTDDKLIAQLLISVAATYGCYVASSILALDPWHLVTSMLQYVLFAPVFVNVLNVYAFSNLHDFTWGTKDQNVQQTDLGVAQAAGKDAVEVSLPEAQVDIDNEYDEALHRLKTRPRVLPPDRTQQQKEMMKQDYYKNVRTNVLLAWALTNGILVAVILHGGTNELFAEGGTTSTKVYMLVVLIFVAAMAAVRFLCSTAYLLVRLFAG